MNTNITAGTKSNPEKAEEITSTRSRTGVFSLLVLVFTAGSVLMSLEIVGSRILAPHFGNSVFVWGGLISVFLVALSLGYYLGGRLADRRPSFFLLNTICIFAAFLIVAIPFVAPAVCETFVTRGYGEQAGPLLASCILFLPASVLIGMVSPFSVRLAVKSLESVGGVSGSFYALSTMGSIGGTLLTTFVLIPSFGISSILKMLGGVLLLVPLVIIAFGTKRSPRFLMLLTLAILAALGMAVPSPPVIRSSPWETVLCERDTPYHHIRVVDADDVRILQIDKYPQGSIQINEPHNSPDHYFYYLCCAFLFKPDIDRAAFIGAGGGIGPRLFQHVNPNMSIDVVDIDPHILEITKRFFFMPESPRMRLIADDGRIFMRSTSNTYDCIVSDAFTIGGRIPFHLITKEYFELCRDRLANDGLLIVNIISAVEGPEGKILRCVARTLKSVFPAIYVFSVEGRRVHGTLCRNVILTAPLSPKKISHEALQDRARESYLLDRFGVVTMLDVSQNLHRRIAWSANDRVFTDDYAPIETLPLSVSASKITLGGQ